ncbi:NUDIX domain [Metamycoplasma cloacale]|uniref:Bis(5'-nucleosyl)-tetraphosphatase [asymmetrical] n=1 Tax=Metamycoplasma cloacale TaxID=92401 RepID=A0A2Z4LNT3_9BACT|nr:NUDIX domain-containing protein [Metamycoplasma cloacale]AWX42917.1 NUDIX domain-containing protein [Metamycoplasma cloacale]VEU79258.1 NUDIX domain [Metamycoplasma cloacale]
MTVKKEKSCGAIVFKHDGHKINVLLVEQNAGHWGFPKGHVEANETEEQTAIREVKEETNIDIKIIDGFREKNTYSPLLLTIKDVIYFVAEPLTDILINQESEIQIVEWVDIQTAKYRITYSDDLKIFNKALQFYIETIQP